MSDNVRWLLLFLPCVEMHSQNTRTRMLTEPNLLRQPCIGFSDRQLACMVLMHCQLRPYLRNVTCTACSDGVSCKNDRLISARLPLDRSRPRSAPCHGKVTATAIDAACCVQSSNVRILHMPIDICGQSGQLPSHYGYSHISIESQVHRPVELGSARYTTSLVA